MNGYRLAVAAWISGACVLLIGNIHGWNVTLYEIVSWGTLVVIAISTTAFIAMMTCCLYADFRVIRRQAAWTQDT